MWEQCMDAQMCGWVDAWMVIWLSKLMHDLVLGFTLNPYLDECRIKHNWVHAPGVPAHQLTGHSVGSWATTDLHT